MVKLFISCNNLLQNLIVCNTCSNTSWTVWTA